MYTYINNKIVFTTMSLRIDKRFFKFFKRRYFFLIFSGRLFQICGPKHPKPLLANITEFCGWIIMSFFFCLYCFFCFSSMKG